METFGSTSTSAKTPHLVVLRLARHGGAPFSLGVPKKDHWLVVAIACRRRWATSSAETPSGSAKPSSLDDKTPSAEGKTPSLDDKTPYAEGKPSSLDDKTPSVEGKTPSLDDKTPSVEGKTPSLDGKTPSAEPARPFPPDPNNFCEQPTAVSRRSLIRQESRTKYQAGDFPRLSDGGCREGALHNPAPTLGAGKRGVNEVVAAEAATTNFHRDLVAAASAAAPFYPEPNPTQSVGLDCDARLRAQPNGIALTPATPSPRRSPAARTTIPRSGRWRCRPARGRARR